MAWLARPGRRLEHLSPHPRGGRVSRHVDLYQFAPTMGDEHQHVQCLEGRGRHRQQVSSPKVMSMVAQERAPGLARRALWSTPAIASNRAVADHDAQLEELTSDALGAHSRFSRDIVLIRSC